MFWFTLLTIVFILIAVVMVLVILVQRPQGGGLAGAFGGAGGGGADTVFGGRVGDALTWATSIIFLCFLLVAVGLNLIEPGSNGRAGSGADSGSQAAPAPDEPRSGAAEDPNLDDLIQPTDEPAGAEEENPSEQPLDESGEADTTDEGKGGDSGGEPPDQDAGDTDDVDSGEGGGA